MKITILVLNYNGEVLLSECLPSIIEAASLSKNTVDVAVIDNESSDRSIDVIKGFSSHVRLIKSPNRVLCSFNDVVRDLEGEVAILLNNDMKVGGDFVDALAGHFGKDDDVFLVAPKCFTYEGDVVECGRTKGFIKYGWFGALGRFPGWESEMNSSQATFQSGFGAVHIKKFLELGGYDDIYLPGRLEDSDICFRAWKRGWKSVYEPRSAVYHKGGASFKKKLGKGGMSEIDARNSLLFFWKNISDPYYWAEHILFFPARILYWTLRRDYSALKGMISAFKKMPKVAERRREVTGMAVVPDRQIFSLFR